MHFHIKKIVIWPKNDNLEPRTISFELGALNIITGASRTGKSAIIPIIDYALGASRCAIPVHIIRDACSWFGVVVQHNGSEILFARREPGVNAAASECYIVEGHSVEVPRTIDASNAILDDVKSRLDDMSGLTKQDFDFSDSRNGFTARPGFRDLSAFLYQPQNVIANQDILFYMTHTREHRERLRILFPYILGAFSVELIAKKHQLEDLRRQLKRKNREYESAQQVSAEWMARLTADVMRARELGLVDVPLSDNLQKDDLIRILRDVVRQHDYRKTPTALTIDESVQEMVSLKRDERSVSHQIAILKKRLYDANDLSDSAAGLGQARRVQVDRLCVTDWLIDHNDSGNCPICGSLTELDNTCLPRLKQALLSIEQSVKDTGSLTNSIDRELRSIYKQLEVETEKLRGVQTRIKMLEARSAEAQSFHYDSLGQAHFIGAVSKVMEIYDRLGEDEELAQELEALREHIKALEAAIAAGNADGRLHRAISQVNTFANRLLPNLDCERPNDPVCVDISELTVKVQGVNREDILAEIGSGSNWLSYHLAIMLGLHKYFLSLSHSAVPSFLIIDQPSQVYFPSLRTARSHEIVDDDPRLKGDDVEAVRKAFATMASAVEESQGGLQLIVVDHADATVWGELPHTNIVEVWRNGLKLVPESWL